jgi:hypothetical protein
VSESGSEEAAGFASAKFPSGSSKFLSISILFPSFIMRLFPPVGDWLRHWGRRPAIGWRRAGGISAPPTQSEVGGGPQYPLINSEATKLS